MADAAQASKPANPGSLVRTHDGAVLRIGASPLELLVTSRASYEVVHKAAAVGIGLVAAISGPTALAVRLAQEAGLTLVGFARDARHTIYAGRDEGFL